MSRRLISDNHKSILKHSGKRLCKIDFSNLVKKPKTEDIDGWLAVNTVDFYNQVNLLYGSITQYCMPSTCPIMNSGNKREYVLSDSKLSKRSIRISAPEYIDCLMAWIQSVMEDTRIFPTDNDVCFPETFFDTVKMIFRRLFRVYVHMFLFHFNLFVDMNEVPHLNTSFSHFIYFIKEFELIDKKELHPLKKVINSILRN